MHNFLMIFFLFLTLWTSAQDHARFVNVFIGTDGTGHTFPGPSMPFGMVQPGPDNRGQGWDYTSGYQYRDTILLGFSQTRLSSTGINELGDLLLLPFASHSNPDLKHRYLKASENAWPGYYSVTKNDGVKVELTCTERVAFHRYTFPENDAFVLADFQHGLRFLTDSLVLGSDIRIEDDYTMSGYCHTKNWVERTWYFVMQFDHPVVHREIMLKGSKENAPRYLLSFRLANEQVLLVKIALSAVGVGGARGNIEKELPGWDFDWVREDARKTWNQYLDRVEIEAPQKEKEIFFTALYHLLLQPSNIADADGHYRGADRQVRQAPGHAYYSTLSIWDVYRGAFPLLQIIAPEKIDAIVNSMLLHHEAAGFLPIWTVWGQDNYCMIGNHAIPMILSAWNNGFRGFDAQEALKAMVETSTKSHINSRWELYERYGYYPFDSLDTEAVSRTLESGYDDWCVARLASQLGDTATAGHFYRRAGFYRNLFDTTTRLFRGRDTRGNWRTPFDPLTATSPMNNPGDYTEANAWQYFWTPAQFDIEGMKKLLGGTPAFTRHLDTFFTTDAKDPDKFLGQEAMIGQYAHGNEPGHHIPYLYALTGSPWTGQRYIRKVIRDFHDNTPSGMIGNDDCGQMSAWYILSSLGFYPVNPASDEFVLGAPQVPKAKLRLPGGKIFTMEALGLSTSRMFTGKVLLDGQPVDKPFITYRQIMDGSKLTFAMTDAQTQSFSRNQLTEKYRRLDFGSIQPSGWLKIQMEDDMRGFVGNLDRLVPDLVNDPIYGTGRLGRNSKAKELGNLKEGDVGGDDQYKWWNSETQSNWWDGYIRNALLLDDQLAREKVRKHVELILSTQDPDGYLGIYDTALRYRFTSENGELWAKTTLLRGLLAYYESTKDKRTWEAIVGAVGNVMSNYPPGTSHPFNAGMDFSGGVAHGLTFTDVLERMWELTGDTTYLGYSAFLYRDFCNNHSSETDAQLHNILDTAYRLKAHGVHTYEHMRPLIAATWATGDPELRRALEIYCSRISQCTTPAGGAIGDEWIAGRTADATNTGYEYCSLHELMDSYSLLFRKSGDPAAADAMENIFFNAAQGSRHPGHSSIAYLKTDNSYEMTGTRNGEPEPGRTQTRYKYSPAHQDVAVCCVPNAGRITPYFVASAWVKEGTATLVCVSPAPVILQTEINGKFVKIETITGYPYDNRFTFNIHCSEPTQLKIRIRKPSWVQKVQSDEKFTEDGSFMVIDRIFSRNDRIEFDFVTGVRVVDDLNQSRYFMHGALVYAVPIDATLQTGREYALGFSDLKYKPLETVRYRYAENHRATFHDGKITVYLTNEKTGKLEKVELVPLSKTILRQAGF